MFAVFVFYYLATSWHQCIAYIYHTSVIVRHSSFTNWWIIPYFFTTHPLPFLW